MNSLIEQIYASGHIEGPNGDLIKLFPTSIPYEEGKALYQLVRTTKPKNTLEIGMAYGISTLFICQAHHDNGSGRHTAVDPFEHKRWQSIGLLNVRRAGIEGVLRFFEHASHEILPQLIQNGERFELVFIDGSHLFDYAMVDFFLVDKLLEVGGYVVLDDIGLPSVRKLLSFILCNRNYYVAPEFPSTADSLWKKPLRFVKYASQAPLDLLPALIARSQRRFCVLRKASEETRQWDHYKPF